MSIQIVGTFLLLFLYALFCFPFYSLFFWACNSKNKTKNTLVNFENCHINDTIYIKNFVKDEETRYGIYWFNMGRFKERDEKFMYYFDRHGGWLTMYKLNAKTKTYNRILDKKNQLLYQAKSFDIQGTDKIYLMPFTGNRDRNKLCLVDTSCKIKWQHDDIQFSCDILDADSIEIINFKILNKSMLYVHFYPNYNYTFSEKLEKHYYKHAYKSAFIHITKDTFYLKRKAVRYPKMYQNLRTRIPYLEEVFNSKNDMVYLFTYTDSIYNETTGKQYPIKSHFHKPIKPYPYRKNRDFTFYDLSKYDRETGRYHLLYYDVYKELYYIIYHHPTKVDENSEFRPDLKRHKTSVLVLNENFQQIKEIVLDENIKFTGVISEKGALCHSDKMKINHDKTPFLWVDFLKEK